MKSLLSVTWLAPLAVCANAARVAENITETFSIDNEGCLYDGTCAPDPLPGPVNGLVFKNLVPIQSYYDILSDEGAVAGLIPIDRTDNSWYARFKNLTQPAVLSSHYNESCVAAWELHSFAAGCNYSPTGESSDPSLDLGAKCTFDVEGFNGAGDCVGHETFAYSPVLVNTFAGYKAWLMTRFNTTAGGLKGKKLRKVKITATKVDETLDLIGIDSVNYTLYNRTLCG